MARCKLPNMYKNWYSSQVFGRLEKFGTLI